MSSVRFAVVLSGMFAVAFAGPASAQKLAPTGVTAIAKVQVTDAAPGTLSCGKSFTVTYTIKNLGAALSSNVVLNGTSTAFSLAKDETKTVVANGGTYDCKKPPAVTASIPAPTIAGTTLTAPLYTRTYAPASLKFLQLNTDTADGDQVYLNATTANCGAPAAVYVKFPAPASKTLYASVMVGDEKLSVTVAGQTAKTVTFTKPLDCSTFPALQANVGKLWRTFSPESVTFKP